MSTLVNILVLLTLSGFAAMIWILVILMIDALFLNDYIQDSLKYYVEKRKGDK